MNCKCNNHPLSEDINGCLKHNEQFLEFVSSIITLNEYESSSWEWWNPKPKFEPIQKVGCNNKIDDEWPKPKWRVKSSEMSPKYKGSPHETNPPKTGKWN